MRSPHNSSFACVFFLSLAIVFSSLAAHAQTIDGNTLVPDLPEIPPEAVAPLGVLVSAPALFDVVSAPASTSARVDTSNAGLTVRVAPGELLPVSVNLSNFGGGARVDVSVEYSIIAPGGEEIYSTNETVAVETTASYVKTLQVPFGTAPGVYVAKTSIIYAGQLVPATTQFPFTVERKILGIFQSDLLLYGGVSIIAAALLVLLGYALFRRRAARFVQFDYSAIPRNERTFYEITSDTIMGMRSRVGDDALRIAEGIEGLRINPETGKVLAITDRPSKVIASLVSEYEKLLGKKVSFSLRGDK